MNDQGPDDSTSGVWQARILLLLVLLLVLLTVFGLLFLDPDVA